MTQHDPKSPDFLFLPTLTMGCSLMLKLSCAFQALRSGRLEVTLTSFLHFLSPFFFLQSFSRAATFHPWLRQSLQMVIWLMVILLPHVTDCFHSHPTFRPRGRQDLLSGCERNPAGPAPLLHCSADPEESVPLPASPACDLHGLQPKQYPLHHG